MDDNSITTKLLTVLNASAVKFKPGKRKRDLEEQPLPSQKLNRRKPVQVADENTDNNRDLEVEKNVDIVLDDALDSEDGQCEDTYEAHFGLKPAVLTEASRDAVGRKAWKISSERRGKIGTTVESIPESVDLGLVTPSPTANDITSLLSTHRDLYLSSTSIPAQQSIREAISLHAISHITKKRRQILKNNDRLTKSSDASPPEDGQDQGFTRPSILVLLPFRSSALSWLTALSTTLPSTTQIENHSRFQSEYGLPQGVTDKLAEAEPGKWPEDHREMFKGNIDDNFRVGVKMTRKSIKLYAEFYTADLILASPLGLKMAIEKQKNADFLSSIEVLIVDKMDALTMQNWDHVQFVFSHLNKLPKESHNTDFSRIKPWYLDGFAEFLRQTILLTAYETPSTRFLYNNLKNVAGKIRTEKRWPAVDVPEGVAQNFVHFDCSSPQDESDKRFHHFTTQLLPTVLRSAVQSSNTVIFIPSSFDFIRVNNYFRKNSRDLGLHFTVLSEYSSNQDISRARQAFFNGKKAFLLISERFHFYRRYAIRGIRNLIFYAPPDHSQFYTEFLSYPFLDEGVDASDLTCRVLYGKYDWFAVERMVGSEAVKGIMKVE